MRRLVRPLLVLSALAFLAWAYYAPHLTVRAMHRAAERGDAKALAAHVDFPALRDHLKAQVAAAVDARVGNHADFGRFGDFTAFGKGLANAAASPMIDTMVSPQALTLLFAGRGLARDGAFATGTRAITGQPLGGPMQLPHWQADMGYEDWSTFTVVLQPDAASTMPVKLIFKRRHLLWWVLSGAELPLP